MKVLLINPPYVTLTARFGTGHQVPLGLLMVGGALLDAGHEVRLLDAEQAHLSLDEICRDVRRWSPDVVMTGHAGSTPAHPTCLEMLGAIRRSEPDVVTVYGGVYPSYHALEILESNPAVDVIVRGEGEAGALALVSALERWGWNEDVLAEISGIALRVGGRPVETIVRPPIRDLDRFRVGWELIEDWDRYTCFGLGRAAIVQFSRGCPHRCTYCGQHGFWVRWRYRDPVRMVDEIEWLYRTHDIRFVTLADENPTTLQPLWRAFLEELASRKLPVKLFATIRATDIVRDAEFLSLYREAGLLYILMGIETTNPEVIREIQKGSSTREDYLACRLLKAHGIYSILGHIVGLEDDTWAGFRDALRQLILYDGDYLNAMYVTPHSWTRFARAMGRRRVAQPEQRYWDYRHQVLEQPRMRPWELFAAVKWLELCFHLRPSKLRRLLARDARFDRRQRLWTMWRTGLVWLAEVVEFVVATRFARDPVTLDEHLGRAEHPAPPLAVPELVDVTVTR